MLLNNNPPYAFVHIYKAAGQSVKLALRRHQYRYLPGLRTPLALALELPVAYAFKPLDHHATAVQIRDLVGPEEWDRLFSFSFVRNPWDWQVSLYHFIQRNRFNYQRRMVSEMTFSEYIRWRVEEDRHLQSSFVVDRHGNQIVDFIGRFESLSQDFATIQHRLGIKARLPHINATAHNRYLTYYDDTTASLVAEAFAEDIERFGYTFE